MGKREKEHRKKVQKRNARIKQMQTSFNNKLQKMLTEKLEEYQKEVESSKKSESTESNSDSDEIKNENVIIDVEEIKETENSK